MDLKAYLHRIRYRGSREPTSETLRALQTAHLQNVPFENLSIHAGEPIILDDNALFEKIVGRRRGGFCYELNGLFGALLRGLGFDVKMLSARVATSDGGYSPSYDHMTLLVTLDERWLVDVGFGDCFREPLRLDDTGVQNRFGNAYRIVTDNEEFVLMERKAGETEKPQYRFVPQAHEYADFVDRCRFHQTSPESHFRKGRVCTRTTPTGRITLSEGKFHVSTTAGARQVRMLSGESEYARLLREEFGIDMGR